MRKNLIFCLNFATLYLVVCVLVYNSFDCVRILFLWLILRHFSLKKGIFKGLISSNELMMIQFVIIAFTLWGFFSFFVVYNLGNLSDLNRSSNGIHFSRLSVLE
jgi:hypothetical protein